MAAAIKRFPERGRKRCAHNAIFLRTANTSHSEVGMPYMVTILYLTLINNSIPRAQMGDWLRGYEGERNNCFSKIQLVGQKSIETKHLSQVHCTGIGEVTVRKDNNKSETKIARNIRIHCTSITCLRLSLRVTFPRIKNGRKEGGYDFTLALFDPTFLFSQQSVISDGRATWEGVSQKLNVLTARWRGSLALCTCHRLAPGVGPRANQGDCKMVRAKLRIFPRGGGI